MAGGSRLGVKRCSCFLPPQESGLSAWIGGQLHPLENVPPVLAVLLITVVVAFFTEFASNTATIIIFLPVLAELVRVLTGSWDGRATSPPQHRFTRLFRDPGSSTGATIVIILVQNA